MPLVVRPQHPTSAQSGTSGFSGHSSGGTGVSGVSGYSGASGVGFSGPSGPSGPSGYSGYSGADGVGSSGASGYSGYSGADGGQGTSGVSGYSGSAGAAGSDGNSGYSGYSGSDGNSGYSGYSGSDGNSGYSGYSGSDGNSGYSGYSGSADSGYSGYSGPSGMSGQGGAGKATITQAAHGFSEGQVIYRTAGAWSAAKADDTATAEAVAVVEYVNGDDFVAVWDGQIAASGSMGWADGEVYFVSDYSAGTLISTEPTQVGNVSKPMMVSTGDSTGVVVNYRGMIIPNPSQNEVPAAFTKYWAASGTSGVRYSGASGTVVNGFSSMVQGGHTYSLQFWNLDVPNTGGGIPYTETWENASLEEPLGSGAIGDMESRTQPWTPGKLHTYRIIAAGIYDNPAGYAQTYQPPDITNGTIGISGAGFAQTAGPASYYDLKTPTLDWSSFGDDAKLSSIATFQVQADGPIYAEHTHVGPVYDIHVADTDTTSHHVFYWTPQDSTSNAWPGTIWLQDAGMVERDTGAVCWKAASGLSGYSGTVVPGFSMTVYAGKRYRLETQDKPPWDAGYSIYSSGASGHYRTPPLTWQAAIGQRGPEPAAGMAFEPSADGPFYAVFAPEGEWETVPSDMYGNGFVCWIERT